MGKFALRRVYNTKNRLRGSGGCSKRALIVALVVALSTVSATVAVEPYASASAHTSGSWALLGVNPWPGIESFGGVSCPNRSDCWVVGTSQGGDGAVFATSDGGRSWSAQTLPSGVTSLDGISCPTANNCWATGVVGGSPAILMTNDGGGRWTDQTFSNTAVTQLNGISCPPGQAQDCWAVGDGAFQAAPSIYILTTTDRGEVWSPQALGGRAGISIECPTDLVCIAGTTDTNDGEAAVDVTQNGGNQWQQTDFETPGAVDSISCPKATQCWIAGVLTDSGAPIVKESTNSGSTWTSETTLSSDDSLSAISCPSTSDCWMTGSDVSSGEGVMVSSTDGGSHWSAGILPSSALSGLALSCASPYICSAVGTSSAGAIMMGSTLQISTSSVPNAKRGDNFTYQLEGTGGRPAYKWTIASGHLPQGITMSSAGVLSGKPRSGDTLKKYGFTAKVTDETPKPAQMAEQQLTLTLT
jgi:photosystem II stability/assembly factor-like uncharacterized protein